MRQIIAHTVFELGRYIEIIATKVKRFMWWLAFKIYDRSSEGEICT